MPPPVCVAAGMLGAWAAALTWPQLCISLPGQRACALAIMLLGALINVVPKWRFRRAGTTVDPRRPQRCSALVQTGLHRYSRNPMYIGHALLLAGWAT
nr:phosphatidylethanolamine N-methyltransferase family protein [Xanthomonas oryzae]